MKLEVRIFTQNNLQLRMIKSASSGFTLVELVVVIVVIAILVAISLPIFTGSSEKSRDTERVNDITSIANELERSYRATAAITGPSYPPTNSTTSTTLSDIVGDSETVIAPKSSHNSIVAASSTADQYPSPNQYIYQSFDASGNLCANTPCVRFILYYYNESSGKVKSLHSMRQQ